MTFKRENIYYYTFDKTAYLNAQRVHHEQRQHVGMW